MAGGPGGSPTSVATRRTRHRLRAAPHDDGGLLVEAGGPDPGWQRVDDRIASLTRATSRVLATDHREARRFASRATELVGVRALDPNPVAAVVRAAYPLLGPLAPFPTPAIPTAIPSELQAGFRQADPREAAHLLFPRRATRPVVRALCDLLTRQPGPVDMWSVAIIVAVAGDLEPDHVARLLTAAAPTATPRGPLPSTQLATFARLVRALPVRRRVAATEAAVGDTSTRARVAYVLTQAPAQLCDHARGATSWELTAVVSATAPAALRELTAAAERSEDAVTGRFTAHRARSVHDLRRIAHVLGNCIDTYVPELQRGEPLVEIRQDGQTRYAVHLRDGRICEFKGHRNRAPDPDDVPAVQELLRAAGLLQPDREVARRDPGARLQDLATDLLGPPRLGRVDWTEVAAAMWCLGHLPRLPDPDDSTWEQVIRDLAARAATGDPLPRVGPPPSTTDRARRAAELRAAVEPRRHTGWQRQVMAAMLSSGVRG